MKQFTLYIISNVHNFTDVLMMPLGQQPMKGNIPINEYDPVYQEEHEKTVVWFDKKDIAVSNVKEAVGEGIAFCRAYEKSNNDALQTGHKEWQRYFSAVYKETK